MRFLYASIYSLTCNPPPRGYMYVGTLGTHQVQYLPTLESHIVTSCPVFITKPFFSRTKKKETESQTAGRGRNTSESGNPRISMKFVTYCFFVCFFHISPSPHLPIPPPAYACWVHFPTSWCLPYLYICTDCTVCKVLVNFYYIFGFLNVW